MLKERDVSLIFETLPVWDEQLARYAAVLIRHRREYLGRLAPFAAEAHAFLTDGRKEALDYIIKVSTLIDLLSEVI